MKYGYQLPVSSYTRYTQYTPTNYTPTYTPALYTAAQYSTAHYTASKYTPTKYAAAAATHLTTSSLYPASYKTTATSSSYSSSSYSSRTRHGSTATAAAQRLTAAPPPPVPKPAPAAKPVRAVHFPNDIIFQDCVRRGELELIGRFIRCRKVRVDTLFLSGMAPIHEAVLTGNLECVKLLVKYGADVHQRDEDGWTALHMACSDGFPDIASYLLSLGASAEAENESGEKPVDLIDPDCAELAKLFQAGVV